MLKNSNSSSRILQEGLHFHNLDEDYAFNIDEIYDEEEDDDDDEEEEEFLDDLEEDVDGLKQKISNCLLKKKKTKGRVKIKMEFIENKIRRYTTFSKRKTGIMKKAYELSTLTGTQVMLLVASETGHVYTFATDKLQPMITSDAGKSLIQSCLSANVNEDDTMAEPSEMFKEAREKRKYDEETENKALDDNLASYLDKADFNEIKSSKNLFNKISSCLQKDKEQINFPNDFNYEKLKVKWN